MSDNHQIEQLIDPVTDSELEQELQSFQQSDLLYITDNNNGSYTNQIQFLCSNLAQQWTTWRDMSLAIPLTFTGVGSAPLAATSHIAFKQSIVDLISGVQLTTATGETILNETTGQVPFINRIRMLVEKDLNWLQEEGAELMFAKDVAAIAPGTTVGLTIPTLTYSTNAGVSLKEAYLGQAVTNNGVTTWNTIVTIPLRYIHDLFDSMSCPVFNTAFTVTFYTAFGSAGNTTVSPMFIDSTLINTTTALIPAVANVSVAPGCGTQATGFNSCRLYYRKVIIPPHALSKVAAKLAAGYTRKFYFRLCDYYPPLASEINGSSSTSRQISNNTSYPLRVWVLGQQNNVSGVPQLGLQSSLSNFQVGFTAMNCKINNNQYYASNINTAQEAWDILKQQFPGYGSDSTQGGLISFQDFLTTYRLNCIDLSRLKERVANPWTQVSIEVDATPCVGTYTGGFDYHYLVEKKWLMSLTMSAGSISASMGPQS